MKFATGVLNTGTAEASIEQLLKQWREQRETEEVIRAYYQGFVDYEVGRFKPVAEAFADVRKRLGTVAAILFWQVILQVCA